MIGIDLTLAYIPEAWHWWPSTFYRGACPPRPTHPRTSSTKTRAPSVFQFYGFEEPTWANGDMRRPAPTISTYCTAIKAMTLLNCQCTASHYVVNQRNAWTTSAPRSRPSAFPRWTPSSLSVAPVLHSPLSPLQKNAQCPPRAGRPETSRHTNARGLGCPHPHRPLLITLLQGDVLERFSSKSSDGSRSTFLCS